LYALLEGPQRFCELTSTVEGLSDRVLSDRLRELELEGVEYKLTEKGRALEPVVLAIRQWAEKWVTSPDLSLTSTTE